MPLVSPIVPGLYRLALGVVNAYLLESGPELVLVDTGYPGSAPRIVRAVHALGRGVEEIRHIVVTHAHADHAGSLAALKAATGAAVYMHAADAALTRQGATLRPMSPSPGPLNHLLYAAFIGAGRRKVEPAEVEHALNGGETLPLAGGVRVIHAPGHSAGQIALLWPMHGGVLLAADAAMSVPTLRLSVAYEDHAEGVRTLERLTALEFRVACFGHGRPVARNAAAQFRARWSHDRRRMMASPFPVPAHFHD